MAYSAVRLSIKPEWVQTPLLEWESDSNESATHLLEWGSLCRITLMLLLLDSGWDNISWVRHSLDCDSLQDQNYSGEKFTLSNHETLTNPTDILNVEWDLSDMVYSRVGLPWVSETLQSDIRFWVRLSIEVESDFNMSETRSLEAESDLSLSETHPPDSGVIYNETQLGVRWESLSDSMPKMYRMKPFRKWDSHWNQIQFWVKLIR